VLSKVFQVETEVLGRMHSEKYREGGVVHLRHEVKNQRTGSSLDGEQDVNDVMFIGIASRRPIS
jgi:acyl dehydratase